MKKRERTGSLNEKKRERTVGTTSSRTDDNKVMNFFRAGVVAPKFRAASRAKQKIKPSVCYVVERSTFQDTPRAIYTWGYRSLKGAASLLLFCRFRKFRATDIERRQIEIWQRDIEKFV